VAAVVWDTCECGQTKPDDEKLCYECRHRKKELSASEERRLRFALTGKSIDDIKKLVNERFGNTATGKCMQKIIEERAELIRKNQTQMDMDGMGWD